MERKRKGGHTAFPTDNRQIVAMTGPGESLLRLLQLLQLHRQLAFAHFILREHLFKKRK